MVPNSWLPPWVAVNPVKSACRSTHFLVGWPPQWTRVLRMEPGTALWTEVESAGTASLAADHHPSYLKMVWYHSNLWLRTALLRFSYLFQKYIVKLGFRFSFMCEDSIWLQGNSRPKESNLRPNSIYVKICMKLSITISSSDTNLSLDWKLLNILFH